MQPESDAAALAGGAHRRRALGRPRGGGVGMVRRALETHVDVVDVVGRGPGEAVLQTPAAAQVDTDTLAQGHGVLDTSGPGTRADASRATPCVLRPCPRSARASQNDRDRRARRRTGWECRGPVRSDSFVSRAASGGKRGEVAGDFHRLVHEACRVDTTHCASPMRCASCAVSGKPMARRIALPAHPARQPRAPPYAGRMPRATCGSRHSARSEATSRSQQKVTMQPMPTAKPLTAPTIGLGKSPRTSKARPRRFERLLMKSAADSSVCVRRILELAPAEKAPPASSPVRIAQRIASSSSMAAKRRARPSLKSAPHALRASGRLRVTTPIAPRCSKETGRTLLATRRSSWKRAVRRGPARNSRGREPVASVDGAFSLSTEGAGRLANELFSGLDLVDWRRLDDTPGTGG